ncbi:hypothetical protein J3459_005992 [Metarhizium acridum]|uniref:uncharacterized protein n=1 Tax=Metarhizium acridum TaxID=92637 RepID=UPI001C6B7C68|nr:hypothetical protein J3458_005788 [Metarhizium acridum]KAG8428206.1 hypothetical protein J3459_005992 [Metarhizium acridum]
MKFIAVFTTALFAAVAMANVDFAPRDEQCKKEGETCTRQDICCTGYCLVWETKNEVSLGTAFACKAVRTLTRRYQGTCQKKDK